MNFFMMVNYTIPFVAVVWSVIIVIANLWGFIKKKSIFPLITLLFSLVSLLVHVFFKRLYVASNLIHDFIWLALSISMYIYIDEIESRRKIISEVFENKYSKDKRSKDESSSPKSFKFNFKNRK